MAMLDVLELALDLPATVEAYVSDGRWVVECPTPGCHSAMRVKDLGRPAEYESFGCINCGYGLKPSAWATVIRNMPHDLRARSIATLKRDMTVPFVMPDAADEIESALFGRRFPAWRNWRPGMTVRELVEAE